MEKTLDEVKKGLECALCDEPADICGEDCPCWSAYSTAEMRQDEHVADALSYIRQLEADNAQQARCIENLTDKLNALNDALPRWISVEERLPEEGELVVFIPTINQGSIYVGKLSHTGARGGVLFENRQGRTTMKYYAKCWMPLPEPPEVTKT